MSPLDGSDFALYRDIYTDAALMRQIGPPLADDQVEPSFRVALGENRQQPWRRLTWKLLTGAEAEVAGLLGVFRDHHDATVAEMGTVILPGWQRQGLATQGLRGLLRRSIATATITTLRLRHQSGNLAMWRIGTGLKFALVQSSNGWQIRQRQTRSRPGD